MTPVVKLKQTKIMEFKVYQSESVSLEDLGTLKTIAGKGGSISLIRKNFNNPDKRVAVVVKRKDGKSATIACSEPVSRMLRAKELNIAELAVLPVLENDKGIAYVCLPGGGTSLQSFDVDALKASKPVALSEEFLPEELVAF
jgi:hypothetical protein